MIAHELLEKVAADVRRHVRHSKGYEHGPWVNPLVPVDAVHAFMMAGLLIDKHVFDHCVAVAPEGHVYGYFFEQLGARVLTVHVDFPPRHCEVLDDLSVLHNQRVLILEDDVVSGLTLRLVVSTLRSYEARSLDLFLGRHKEDQVLENIPPEIGTLYVAEDYLDPLRREDYESSFAAFFGLLSGERIE